MKAKAVFFVGILVSIFLLYFSFKDVDWVAFRSALASTQLILILPLTLFLSIHFGLRALRWRYFLDGGDEISIRKLFDGIMVGNFLNFLLPMRAGEFARPFFISLTDSRPFAPLFLSIVIERFFDLTMVLLTFGLLLPMIPTLPDWVMIGAKSFITLAGCLMVGLSMGILFEQFCRKLIIKICGLLPQVLSDKVSEIGTQVLDGLKVIRSWKRLIIISLLTVLVWGSNYLIFQFSFLLVGEHVSLLQATAIAVILALSVAAPSAPGFIGVYQAACVAGFALFSLPQEKAVVYAIVTHMHLFILFIAYGVFVLSRYGISVSDLKKTESTSALPS